MSVSSKLSVFGLLAGLAVSGSASATSDYWDTSAPWNGATLSHFAGWDVFGGSLDTTPDVAGSGTGIVQFPGYAYSYGTGNVTNYMPLTDPILYVTLGSDTTSYYDVYLRIETYKMKLPLGDAKLTYVDSASNTVTLSASGQHVITDANSLERESYWVFSGVEGASSYSLQVYNLQSQYNNFQLVEVATVAVPVDEPQTYSMLAAGLGLLGFAARRRAKRLAA